MDMFLFRSWSKRRLHVHGVTFQSTWPEHTKLKMQKKGKLMLVLKSGRFRGTSNCPVENCTAKKCEKTG